MKGYFLGVDIGSTTSHALVADETGQVLGIGKAGPGNHEVVGYDGLQNTLRIVTREALESADIGVQDITGAGFGVSGYDWPSERDPTLKVLQSLDLSAPLEVVNDTIIGLIAGTEQGWGIAIVAGSGENCWGWDRQRNIGRVTGNGGFMGEYGGGWSIVVKAIQAVAAAWSRRGPTTLLTQSFMEATGAQDEAQLLEGVSLEQYALNADTAMLVFQAAEMGDEVAIGIIEWAGRELGSLANGVIRQLGFEDLAFEVVLSGGLFEGGKMLVYPLKDTIWKVAPGARFTRLSAPPVAGAVMLGMEVAGIDSHPLRQELVKSARQAI